MIRQNLIPKQALDILTQGMYILGFEPKCGPLLKFLLVAGIKTNDNVTLVPVQDGID